MDVNKVTQELLAAGYTETDIPPGMRAYSWFYGGFQYDRQSLAQLVFETPCGLLAEGSHFSNGMMSYMGIDWMPENDNPVACCPRFSKEPCTLNHPLLRSGWGHNEKIVECACHKTDRKYCYESSLDKVHDEVRKEADDLFQVFSDSKRGRVCKLCSNYSRSTKTWTMFYDPLHKCTQMNCSFCAVLQKELSPKKGNVFYDLKTTWTEKGQGFFPDVQHVSIHKGEKLLKNTTSMTLCEVIAKSFAKDILNQKIKRSSKKLTADLNSTTEVMNIHAERRSTRDLMQDLQDVAEGIKVVHAGDVIKAAAQQKRERKEGRQIARVARLERLIAQNGYEAIEDLDRHRAEKLLEPRRIAELQRQWKQKQAALAEPEAQMRLF